MLKQNIVFGYWGRKNYLLNKLYFIAILNGIYKRYILLHKYIAKSLKQKIWYQKLLHFNQVVLTRID